MAKKKYYVVWVGRKTGVFDSWRECEKATEGYSYAKYESFTTREDAEEAFEMGYEAYQESLIRKKFS